MPFSLTNAVATFCALMDKLFSTYQWDFVLCFIDDCLVFTPNDFNLHLAQLEKVLLKLNSANMRLNLAKCHFAATELPFLGHIVGRFGLKMDLVKVQKLKSIKLSTNKKQVRQFLGLAGYFRDFIKDFAEIAAPLTDLTKDSHIDTFVLTEKEKLAAELLKQKVSEYPILQFPDFNLPFILETDASQKNCSCPSSTKRTTTSPDIMLKQTFKPSRKKLLYCRKRSFSSSLGNQSLSTISFWKKLPHHYRPQILAISI